MPQFLRTFRNISAFLLFTSFSEVLASVSDASGTSARISQQYDIYVTEDCCTIDHSCLLLPCWYFCCTDQACEQKDGINQIILANFTEQHHWVIVQSLKLITIDLAGERRANNWAGRESHHFASYQKIRQPPSIRHIREPICHTWRYQAVGD